METLKKMFTTFILQLHFENNSQDIAKWDIWHTTVHTDVQRNAELYRKFEPWNTLVARTSIFRRRFKYLKRKI